jgi:hypothetical protein
MEIGLKPFELLYIWRKAKPEGSQFITKNQRDAVPHA